MVVSNSTDVNLAEGRVAEARRIVERQRWLITKIKACNDDCAQEEELLSTFEKSLAIFEDDLANVISKQVDGTQAPSALALALQTGDI
jgi:hypothetical protein